jgi:hypothetical protein
LRVWAGPPVQFAAPVNSATGTIDPIAIAAADFNGDGTFLIVTNSLLNAMGGALAVGDFNGDAKATWRS